MTDKSGNLLQVLEGIAIDVKTLAEQNSDVNYGIHTVKITNKKKLKKFLKNKHMASELWRPIKKK